jgi:hypothetical protein
MITLHKIRLSTVQGGGAVLHGRQIDNIQRLRVRTVDGIEQLRGTNARYEDARPCRRNLTTASEQYQNVCKKHHFGRKYF